MLCAWSHALRATYTGWTRLCGETRGVNDSKQGRALLLKPVFGGCYCAFAGRPFDFDSMLDVLMVCHYNTRVSDSS